MDQKPLVIEQIEAGARFLREFEKYAPVMAAYWIRPSDDGDWFLYVASDKINDDNFDVAYGEVIRITSQKRDPALDPFQIKVVGVDDPLAQAVLGVMGKFPSKLPLRYNGQYLGGASVDGVYIYPVPIPDLMCSV